MGKVSYSVLEDIERYNQNFKREYYEHLDEEKAHQIFREWYAKNLPVDLLTWSRVNEPGEEMVYKQGYWNQIVFVRDTINSIFHSRYEIYKDNPVMVINTHMSKSITLPVYQIEVKNYGLKLILRDNFHGWVISVISEVEIKMHTMGLFKVDNEIHPVYCEGFDKSLVFGSYKDNKKQFTIAIDDDFKVYTFMYLLNNYFRKKVQGARNKGNSCGFKGNNRL